MCSKAGLLVQCCNPQPAAALQLPVSQVCLDATQPMPQSSTLRTCELELHAQLCHKCGTVRWQRATNSCQCVSRAAAQELQQQWQSLQTDRGLLMQQLHAEQDKLREDKVNMEAAK